MTTAWVAGLSALAVGLAVLLLGSPRPRRPRVDPVPGTDVDGWPSRGLLLAAPLVGAGLVATLSGRVLALSLIGLAVALGVMHLVGLHRRSRAAEARRDRVQEFCDGLAAELAAGVPPQRALARVSAEWPEFAAVGVGAGLGVDVPTALRGLSETPGAEDLRLVAATWQVAHRSGSGLTDALTRVADTIRGRRATSRLAASELASAHATGRLMAAMPGLTLMMGYGLGADPLGFLTGTAVGLGCLAAGLLLSFVGLRWLHRIETRVVPR